MCLQGKNIFPLWLQNLFINPSKNHSAHCSAQKPIITAIRTAAFVPSFSLALAYLRDEETDLERWRAEEGDAGKQTSSGSCNLKTDLLQGGANWSLSKSRENQIPKHWKTTPTTNTQKAKPLKVSKLLNTRKQTKIFAMSYLLECRSVGANCWAESQHSQASVALHPSDPWGSKEAGRGRAEQRKDTPGFH